MARTRQVVKAPKKSNSSSKQTDKPVEQTPQEQVQSTPVEQVPTETQPTETQPTETQPTEQVQEPAPVKKTRAPRKKTTPVPEVEETVPEVEVEADPEPTVGDKIDDLVSCMDALFKEQKAVCMTLKKLKKEYTKELKEAHKSKRKKRKTTTGEKPKNGFARPSKLSPELCHFLGVPKDTELSRTQVTGLISKYIKEHDLQIQENRKNFVVDQELEKVLGKPRFPYSKKNPDQGNGYGFFNLQRYLNGHFIKIEKPEVEVTATTEVAN